jgi:hypothetical protein
MSCWRAEKWIRFPKKGTSSLAICPRNECSFRCPWEGMRRTHHAALAARGDAKEIRRQHKELTRE